MRKQRSNVEVLRGLLDQARRYADLSLREAGQVTACAMAENQEGTLMLVPPRITTERDKDRFAEAARLLAIGYEVKAIALTGEMKGCTIQELCRIVRDDKGAFQEFGTPPLPRVEKMEGRFAGILPRQKPSIQEVQMARFNLAGLGYRVEGINDQQSLN